MKAIILVAGEGQRLRPYTADRPKCLVEVEGRSLLDRQLDVLRAEGIKDVVLIKGYLADKWDRPGTRTRLNERYAQTNMLWTLFSAREELEGDVLVCYGDIVYSREVLRKMLASKADISVAIDKGWEAYWRARSENPLADAETLKIAADGSIREIGQKPKSLSEIEGQYIGLVKYTSAGLRALTKVFDDGVKSGIRGKTAEKAYMTDALQALIDAGVKLTPVHIDGQWVEVDTTEDLNLPITRSRVLEIASGV